MLADFLSEHPEIVREVAAHAVALESVARSNRARRERLRAMLDGLVDALQHGAEASHIRAALLHGGDGELRVRELLRHDILAKLEQSHVHVPEHELTLLSDWVWASEYDRLLETNAERSALLDLCPSVAAIVSLEGHVQYVNRAAAQLIHQMTGLVGDQIIGKTGHDLGFLFEAGPTPAHFRALARTSSTAEVMVSGHWYEIRTGELIGADGAVRALGLTLADIHDRKIGLIRLELLSKLSRLVGTADIDELWTALAQVAIPQLADWCAISVIENQRVRSTFIAHRDPSRVKLRDQLLRIANGLSFHPLWRDLAPTGFQLLSEVSDDLLRTVLLDDQLYQIVAELNVRSLMVVPIVSRGQPIAIMTFAHTAESGRRYGHDDPTVAVELALHAAHIAENARLVGEAKASELRFRVALADARTIVYEQDESLRYVWNYGHELPYSMIGKTHADALPADEAAALTKLKQQVIDTGEPLSAEIELSFGGVKRWYRETIEPVRDRVGRPVGVIGTATDLTDEKRAQRALQSAVEVRDRVMGILGHDLRNPLSTMTMAAGMLLERADLPADARRPIATIEHAARRMTEMIETLLDFTRVRISGKPLPIARIRCDIADVTREIVDELRAASPDRVIELEVRGDTQGSCDAPRIAQALANLLANAITYGDPQRPIRVGATGEEAMLVLSVHNEGPPIPDWLRPVLFEPFSRGEPDVISPHGLGLGLFVVKEIVTSHHGTIDVESTALAGTTFTIRLPRQAS